jgi:hypothetical protein
VLRSTDAALEKGKFVSIHYWKAMDAAAPLGEPIGMEALIQGIRSSYPSLKFGYFNPPKEKFGK